MDSLEAELRPMLILPEGLVLLETPMMP